MLKARGCKRDSKDESVRSDVELFCDRVHRLKEERHIGTQLWHDARAQSLMERTASAFFEVITGVLVDRFLLEVAKLTDPARSTDGRYENFTIRNMLETIDWQGDVSRELAKLYESVLEFRKYIQAARNKLLAHYDKEAVVSGNTLGAFPEGEDERVLCALEQMCNVMHKASVGEVYGHMVASRPGDVSDLKRAMRNALAFENLLAQSKGEELRRLVGCLDDVDKGVSQLQT